MARQAIVTRLRFSALSLLSTAALGFAHHRGRAVAPVRFHPSSSRHLTVIARLPASLALHAEQLALQLKPFGPLHHYYPAHTIHLTIQNLDLLNSAFAADGIDQGLRKILNRYAPFAFTAAGLGISPNTIFVQLYAHDDTLHRLRKELESLIGVPRGAFGALMWRALAFANVVRFAGSVSGDFLREAMRRRAAPLDAFEIAEMEVVHTDKVLSDDQTKVIDRIRLRAA